MENTCKKVRFRPRFRGSRSRYSYTSPSVSELIPTLPFFFCISQLPQPASLKLIVSSFSFLEVGSRSSFFRVHVPGLLRRLRPSYTFRVRVLRLFCPIPSLVFIHLFPRHFLVFMHLCRFRFRSKSKSVRERDREKIFRGVFSEGDRFRAKKQDRSLGKGIFRRERE